jgi:hypothetical protein
MVPAMADTTVHTNRRLADPKDRRHATRGGRRAGERGRRWRHLGLLIAGYAMYVGVRTVTDRARGLLRRARQ